MTDSSVVGELLVRLGLDDKAFDEAMGKAQGKISGMEQKLGSVGKSLTTKVSVPLIAAGAAAVTVANKFDKAYGIIRAGTGATGEALEELKGITDELYGKLPNDLEEVATAVADLNTMFGLQGEELEAMATQYLNLARITGTDVSTIIQSAARTFGDWTVATEDQSDALDYLFRVTQSTGIEIDKLNQLMVQYGAPLRQMGFEFDEAAALMGKFYKEGVNVELVLGSLRIALGQMAREGVTDASEALRILIDDIKNAGSVGEANARAIEIFGSRAGPDMAAAIREGRFEVDELLETLRNGTDTINDVGDETLTFSDHLKELKHQAELALKPLGEVLVETLLDNKASLESVVGVFVDLAEAFRDLPDPIQGTIVKLLAVAAALGPILWTASKLIGVLGAVKGAAVGLSGALATLGVSAGLANTPLAASLGALGIGADAALAMTTAGYGLVGGMAAYTLYDIVKNAKDLTKGETNMPGNYYLGYGATSSTPGMDFGYDIGMWNRAGEGLEKVEQKYEEVTRSIRENGIIDVINEEIRQTQLEPIYAQIELLEGEIEKIRSELEAKLGEINVQFGGKFSDQTLRYLERMQGATEDYQEKYDIKTQEGLEFAISSLTDALDEEQLRSMGYSDEDIANMQETLGVAQDQLTTQNEISALADAIATSSGKSAEEQAIMKEFLEGIFTTAEEYKNTTDELLTQANEKIDTLNGQIEDANAIIEGTKTATETVGENVNSLAGHIDGIAGAIREMEPPVVNVSPPKVEVNINNIPIMAEGGYTGSYEGLAYLHPNEYVVPADKLASHSYAEQTGDPRTHSLLLELIDAVRGMATGSSTTNVFGTDLDRLSQKIRQGGV